MLKDYMIQGFALNEYKKYQVIDDNKYVSDFDKLLLETKNIDNNL